MNKVWIIARHEFLTAVRRWSYVILTLSLPLLALIGMLAYTGISKWAGEEPPPEKLEIGYVDNVGIFDGFTDPEGATFVLYDTEDEARQSLFDEDIAEYFVIPAEYPDNGSIARYTTEREIEPPYSTLNLIEDFLIANLIADDVSGETLARVQNPLYAQSFRLDPVTGEVAAPEDELSAFLMPYAFGLLFLFSLLFSSGYLLQGVAEEKENRLIEILLSSVSARQLLTGKVLGLGLAGLLQIAVWLTTTFVFISVASASIVAMGSLNISVGTIFLAMLYFVLGYLLFGVLFAAIGSIGSTARESNQWTSLLVMPAVLPLALIALFVTNPDHVVFTILTLFPLTSPIAAVMKLSIGALPLWELIASVLIMIISIVVSMWAASRVFRTFLLMYGKRPSVKDIWRYLREA